MNLNSIATNLALRFAPAQITPPSGYANVTTSTHLLPNAITNTPCVLVLPPIGTYRPGQGGAQRIGQLDFPVNFYLSDSADEGAQATALYAWYSVLMDQVTGDYDLGLSPPTGPVVDAFITDTRAGTLTYAGHDYVGISLTVTVRLQEAYNATT